MKRLYSLVIGGLVVVAASGLGARATGLEADGSHPADLSFRNEVGRAIDRGLEFLLSSQNTNGWWSTPDHPAVAALALSAFMGEPGGRYRTNLSPALSNTVAYLVGSAKPDGSFYRTSLINYNTALCMMGLLSTENPAHHDLLRRGRAFLARSQVDLGLPGKIDSPFDGGVGYGDKYAHSDMNNTLMALEALHYTRHLARDVAPAEARDLNWEAVTHFLQSCQNLPGRNTEAWVSEDPKDRGGFVYYPGHSMAGGVTNPATGRVALRSYGSISYAGLLSYIYASLNREDPRVKAVLDWLTAHYTLEENPGMGPQGYYYYLHLLTKGLSAAGVDALELKDGTSVNWRRQTAMRLINLQQKDGSWANTDGRWWERDPNLVTAYSVLALEIIYRGL